jgi:hypothetical protein
VPEALAPNYTAGRYNPGPIGAAGEYWVNTYAADTRLLYVLPALTLHEAVPGHHLQGALARELRDLPVFRLNYFPHAFGEGWALYCEKLGEEMGVYHTPYQRFGRLTYEMWRACRLVVDTGMHAMGWTREQAQAYLAANTGLSLHEIRTEVDRYIAWPGQALAYKVGELKIASCASVQGSTWARISTCAPHDVLGTAGSRWRCWSAGSTRISTGRRDLHERTCPAFKLTSLLYDAVPRPAARRTRPRSVDRLGVRATGPADDARSELPQARGLRHLWYQVDIADSDPATFVHYM